MDQNRYEMDWGQIISNQLFTLVNSNSVKGENLFESSREDIIVDWFSLSKCHSLQKGWGRQYAH